MGRRTFHRNVTHVPRWCVAPMLKTAEVVRKPRLTLVNGMAEMVPPGSGSVVLNFVTSFNLCSELLSPASLPHDPVSFQVTCPFPFHDHRLREGREFVVSQGTPAPGHLPAHSRCCSRTPTFMEHTLSVAWAMGLVPQIWRKGKVLCRPQSFHLEPCEWGTGYYSGPFGKIGYF